MWLLYALGSALFAGMTAILSKQGIRDLDSNLATALRTFVVLLFSWMMVFVVGSQGALPSISGHTLLFLVLSGLATGGSWLCYFKALQLGDVNKVTPIDKSSTLLTMLLAMVFLGEALTWSKGVAMVLLGVGTWWMLDRRAAGKSKGETLAGVSPTAATLQQTGQRLAAGHNAWLLYATGAALFASLTAILGKVGIQGVESNLGTAIRTVVVLVMAWLVVWVNGKRVSLHSLNRRNIVFLVLSGMATGGSWLCYYKALQMGPASVVVPIDKLSILVTLSFARVFLKEHLTKKALGGLVLIVAGTMLLLF